MTQVIIVSVAGFGIVLLLTIAENTILSDLQLTDSGHLFGYEEMIYQDDETATSFSRRMEEPPLKVSGKPDMIVRDELGDPVVLELKSGTRDTDQFDGHRMQSLMYLWILQEALGEPISKGELIYLDDDRPEGRVQIKFDSAARQEFMRTVSEFYDYWFEQLGDAESATGGASA